jgi:hypothetical protein
MRRAQATMDVPSCRSLSTLRPWGSLMVEIGPEGGRRHNSPLIIPLPFEGRRPEAPLEAGGETIVLLLPSLPNRFYTPSTSTLLLLLSRNKEGNKETLSKPKAERLAGAFGALFSFLCVRFIKGVHYL